MSYILLVEDNLENANMMIRLLESAGHEVQHTTRGMEGSRLARERRPDLILMDFDLPDINGRVLILTLKRQLGDTHAPPVVAVTAHNTPGERLMAQKFGCSAFISKPFDPKEFLDVITQLLESSTLG